MTDLLRLSRASFGYGERVVVAGVDLTVDAGALIGIVGPNGAGKTTLFRGMLGLIPPLSGVVERFTDAVGYVPRREALDPIYPLRVDEVVHMGAYGRLSGWRSLTTTERALADACLARVALAERAHDAFSSLSGGQRQRVLIARALMMRPRLLLLDEPTSGVDRDAQRVILELLRELHREEGMAVLMVSHQIGLIRESVHEIIVVSDGRIRKGPADEMLRADHLDPLFAGGARGETRD